MTSKQPQFRSIDQLSRLDDILAEDGVLEEFQAIAIEEVLAWQRADTQRKAGLT
jgi:hypothetical protein